MSREVILNVLFELVCSFGLKLLYSLITLVLGLKLIGWLKKAIPRLNAFERLDTGVRTFLSSALSIALYVLLGVTVAMILGVPTASFIAALASCLAAIGLAMQGSLSNFAGGMMLLIFQPFRADDYISVPDLNAEGTVKKITAVYTVLHTYDGIEVTIPNGTLTNSVVKNMSTTDARRLDLSFRVDPKHPVAEIEAILAGVVAEEKRVLPDPAPFTRLTDVAGDALTYAIRIWCPNPEYWNVRFDLTRAVQDAFERHSIVIPRSRLDVRLDETESAEAPAAEHTQR
ncbi:MAG: mechanosensitive ion channel family protein [Clostridia bacterium]|nr:mechanosensitive ion channel family protein [Clostridia bacterium]